MNLWFGKHWDLCRCGEPTSEGPDVGHPAQDDTFKVSLESRKRLDSLADGDVVVFGALLLKFVLDVAPDGVAGFDGLEEALGVFGDGFEVADEGGAVGIVLEEGLKARVGARRGRLRWRRSQADIFQSPQESWCRSRESYAAHTATSLMPVGCGWTVPDCGGVRGA